MGIPYNIAVADAGGVVVSLTLQLTAHSRFRENIGLRLFCHLFVFHFPSPKVNSRPHALMADRAGDSLVQAPTAADTL